MNIVQSPQDSEPAWVGELEELYPLNLDEAVEEARVANQRNTRLCADLQDEDLARFARNTRHLKILKNLKAYSALVVPMPGGAQSTTAVFTLFSCPPRRHFDEQDLKAM